MAISFAAGETVTALKLNKLQPKTYFATGTGTVAAGSTNAAITGASVTFTTVAANALYVAHAVLDVDLTGAGTGTLVGRIFVDAVTQIPLIVFAAEVATDRATVGNSYSGTLAAAGSHTIDLRVTTQANQTVVGSNSSILVVVYEQN